MKYIFKRVIRLPGAGSETFFLWGLVRRVDHSPAQDLSSAVLVRLAQMEEYRRYLQKRERIREELAAASTARQVVIDEVQKVPQLLDEARGYSTTAVFSLLLADRVRAESSAGRPIYSAAEPSAMGRTD